MYEFWKLVQILIPELSGGLGPISYKDAGAINTYTKQSIAFSDIYVRGFAREPFSQWISGGRREKQAIAQYTVNSNYAGQLRSMRLCVQNCTYVLGLMIDVPCRLTVWSLVHRHARSPPNMIGEHILQRWIKLFFGRLWLTGCWIGW